MARRKATSDAVRSATSSTSAVRSEQVKSTSEQTASHSAHTSEQAGVRQTATHEGHQTVQQTVAKTAEHTSHAASEVARTQHHTASSFQGVGLGGAIFAESRRVSV